MRHFGTIAFFLLIVSTSSLTGYRIYAGEAADNAGVPGRSSSDQRLFTDSPIPTSDLDRELPLDEDGFGWHLVTVTENLTKIESPIATLKTNEPSMEKVFQTGGAEVLSELRKGDSEQTLQDVPERLVIPALKVNAKIVFAPFSVVTWDISTLGQDIAWLESLEGQNKRNNLVLAGHATLYDGRNGPLYYAIRLKPGDKMFVYSSTRVYSYVLREVSVVYPEEISILEETPSPQLTLITCTTWDEETSTYLRRLVFHADLVKVESRSLRITQ